MAIARSIFAALALVIAVAACDSGDIPAPSQYGTLQGVILDHATSQPIAGAVVTVDTILTAVTDANGKFTIDKIPVGDFDYTVHAKGYTDFAGSGRTAPTQAVPLNLQLDKATSS
jgi:hypothetical protein